MRAMAAIATIGGLLLLGCGSDGPEKKPAGAAPAAPAQASEDRQQPQPPPGDGKQWSDYGPGDPRGDIKALQKAKETAKKVEDRSKADAKAAEDSE